MQIKRVLCTASAIPLVLLLTSCGGGDNHGSQLAELDAALVQEQVKENNDVAALAQARAAGASQATIAQLEATIAADNQYELLLSSYAAASSFESAQAAVVHPAAVTANRQQLIDLIRNNFFGQNTPAIADLEAQYEEMWAQDVAAMTGH